MTSRGGICIQRIYIRTHCSSHLSFAHNSKVRTGVRCSHMKLKMIDPFFSCLLCFYSGRISKFAKKKTCQFPLTFNECIGIGMQILFNSHTLHVFTLPSGWRHIKYHAPISSSIIIAQKTTSECKDRERRVWRNSNSEMCVAYFLCGASSKREKRIKRIFQGLALGWRLKCGELRSIPQVD